jgi:hypothetical protein
MMPRWEYCQVFASRLEDEGELVFLAEEGLKRAEFKRDRTLGDKNAMDAAGRVIAKLGNEGWDLIGGTPDVGTRGATGFLFKRPKLYGPQIFREGAGELSKSSTADRAYPESGDEDSG